MAKKAVGASSKKTYPKKQTIKSSKATGMAKPARTTKSSTGSSKKSFCFVSGLARKITIYGIITCIVVVVLSLIVNQYFEPSKVADRKLDEMAKTYYEDYFYDKFVNAISDDKTIEEAMQDFVETGFAKVPLRHLLSFDNGKYKDFEKYFNSLSYACNTSESYIKITPSKPYSKKNYEVSKSLTCNYK